MKNDPIAPEAIRTHFDGIDATLRTFEKMHAAAEPKHLDALLKFAARAYRRPLIWEAERDDILAYWVTAPARQERSDSRRGRPQFHRQHPDVARLLLSNRSGIPRSASVTTKPCNIRPTGAVGRPLVGYALASRLSYFLWSSMPDQEA